MGFPILPLGENCCSPDVDTVSAGAFPMMLSLLRYLVRSGRCHARNDARLRHFAANRGDTQLRCVCGGVRLWTFSCDLQPRAQLFLGDAVHAAAQDLVSLVACVCKLTSTVMSCQVMDLSVHYGSSPDLTSYGPCSNEGCNRLGEYFHY